MTYQQVLKAAVKRAETKKMEPEAVEFLFFELSNLSGSEFFLNFECEVPKTLYDVFQEKLGRYLNDKIPVQHLVGHSYFYGRKFTVNESVLIPRTETEELVENVLIYFDEYFSGKPTKLLDIGTGSGCIAISLDLEESTLAVDATDISEDALKTAEINQKNLQSNVTFFKSDWFSNIKESYNIIVSNPPYIPNAEFIEDVVSKEPALALFGGADGTIFYEEVLKGSVRTLNAFGLIAFEHGFDQSKKIRELATKYFPEAIIIQKSDLQGKDRMTFIGVGGVLK